MGENCTSKRNKIVKYIIQTFITQLRNSIFQRKIVSVTLIKNVRTVIGVTITNGVIM